MNTIKNNLVDLFNSVTNDNNINDNENDNNSDTKNMNTNDNSCVSDNSNDVLSLLDITLQQGRKFKEYQNKIQENFTSMQNSNNQNKFLLQNEYNKLLNEYKQTLEEYDHLKLEFEMNSTDLSKRIDRNNKYLNKYIRFKTGELCYVTNEGVAKLISEYNKKIYVLQNKLNSLSYQISGKIDKINDFTRNITYSGKEGFEGFTKRYVPKQFLDPILMSRNIKRKIIKEEKNTQHLDNILKDTDIKILQQNYVYMMWTILALAAVLVTLKIKNNN